MTKLVSVKGDYVNLGTSLVLKRQAGKRSTTEVGDAAALVPQHQDLHVFDVPLRASSTSQPNNRIMSR
jgi:hypothetical protein